MTRKERYSHIINWFRENVPIAETELHYTDSFSLLVAVILSAQCTDKRVNMITPKLLADFPTPQTMANSSPEVIFQYIRSISFPNNKANYLWGMAQKLVIDFGGEIPDDIDLLQTLPGVGRKTANVILSILFKKPAMAVDTHVFRVSERLGLTKKSRTPFETEQILTTYIPASLIPIAHHWLILHGRYICIARKPRCEACGLTQWCLFFERSQNISVKMAQPQKAQK
jgi:endonuclease-3